MSDCDLGVIQFRWRHDHPLRNAVNNHGFQLAQSNINGALVGVVDSYSGTLTLASSGCGIKHGAVLRHNAAICAAGKEIGRS